MQFLKNLIGKRGYKMTYANVILKNHDNWVDCTVKSTIEPFLEPLINDLALKYPQWTFEEAHSQNNQTEKTVYATKFKVIERRDTLGFVGIDLYSNSNTKRYVVDNERIDKLKYRGCGMKTIHKDKALKHVAKYFGKKSLQEKLGEAKNKSEQASHTVLNEKRHSLSTIWNGFSTEAKNFVLSKWEEFETQLPKPLKSNAEKFPLALAEYTASDLVFTLMNKKESYLVFVDGMDYALSKEGEEPKIMASENLPDYIRKAVGMLKLVEKHQIIGGIGLKVSNDTFIVLPQDALKGEVNVI